MNNIDIQLIKKAIEGDKDATQQLNLEPLQGDASSRRYFRISIKGEKFIVMLLPQDTKSEEISKELNHHQLPFIDVANYLKKGGIGVPDIILANPKERIIILEDLGDWTIERLLKEEYNKYELYRLAIDEMIKMHKWALEHPDDNCICFKRQFDKDLLMWEFDHFFQWGLLKLSDKQPTQREIDTLRSMFHHVTQRLCNLPKGFIHRDYQSRNLMLKQGRLRIIDFQDALIGPFIYDFTSLLRDSYVFFDNDETEYFLVYYFTRRNDMGLPMIPLQDLKEAFLLQTIQRKLKDAGRFVYIDRVKGNPKFLPNIPRSLYYATEALKQFNEYASALNIITKYLGDYIGVPE